ncbi:hypothetical protein ACS0TY_024855 [Phlomoides rotata]
MGNSALLKQEFLKKWIKGLQLCRNSNKNMSISDRKNAIKLSADVAIASTRKASIQWSRALLSDVVSRDGNNKGIVEQIVGYKVEKRALIACSKRIIRRSHVGVRKARRVVPRSVMKSSAIAKKLVKNRTRVLKRLVPGGEEMNEISLIRETLDYIASLRIQVDVMRRLANAAEKLVPSKIS